VIHPIVGLRTGLKDVAMARKRNKPEEIVAKLRQVDVLTAQGKSTAEAVRTIAVVLTG